MGHDCTQANEWLRLSSPFPFSLPPLPRPIMLKYEGMSEQSKSSDKYLFRPRKTICEVKKTTAMLLKYFQYFDLGMSQVKVKSSS